MLKTNTHISKWYNSSPEGIMTALLTESIKMNDLAFGPEAEGWEKYTSTEYSVSGSRQTGVCRRAILFSRNKAQLWTEHSSLLVPSPEQDRASCWDAVSSPCPPSSSLFFTQVQTENLVLRIGYGSVFRSVFPSCMEIASAGSLPKQLAPAGPKAALPALASHCQTGASASSCPSSACLVQWYSSNRKGHMCFQYPRFPTDLTCCSGSVKDLYTGNLQWKERNSWTSSQLGEPMPVAPVKSPGFCSVHLTKHQ